MSEAVLAERTAEYVLKNRRAGWLKYALQVLAAEPYLRNALIGELCEDVRQELRQRLTGYEVAGEPGEWFTVDISCDDWGPLSVSLGNWKHDASSVAIGVYNDGERLSEASSVQIKDRLATKRSPWNRTGYSEWVWNISPNQNDWHDLNFLMRVAEARKAVVGEVAKDLLEVVDLLDDLLRRLANVEHR